VRRAALLLVFLVGCATTQKPAPVVDRKQPARASTPAAKPAPAPAPAAGTYVVKKGDTLYSIALEHGADYREVAAWNRLGDPTKINVGQVLRVTPPEESRVQVGKAKLPERGEARPLDLPPPQQSPAKPQPQPQPAKPAEASAAEFIWPAKGKVIAGFAEPRRKGIDIDAKLGDPVIAAAAGRVTYTGAGIPGLGKLVVIKHDNGFITVYAHNRDILVKEQQAVRRGQKIAEVGNTDADRPKLHFQIRKGSAAVDPMRYLPAL
jgi:lipoprotein NlpD